jgi:hypothetical protein
MEEKNSSGQDIFTNDSICETEGAEVGQNTILALHQFISLPTVHGSWLQSPVLSKVESETYGKNCLLVRQFEKLAVGNLSVAEEIKCSIGFHRSRTAKIPFAEATSGDVMNDARIAQKLGSMLR